MSNENSVRDESPPELLFRKHLDAWKQGLPVPAWLKEQVKRDVDEYHKAKVEGREFQPEIRIHRDGNGETDTVLGNEHNMVGNFGEGAYTQEQDNATQPEESDDLDPVLYIDASTQTDLPWGLPPSILEGITGPVEVAAMFGGSKPKGQYVRDKTTGKETVRPTPTRQNPLPANNGPVGGWSGAGLMEVRTADKKNTVVKRQKPPQQYSGTGSTEYGGSTVSGGSAPAMPGGWAGGGGGQQQQGGNGGGYRPPQPAVQYYAGGDGYGQMGPGGNGYVQNQYGQQGWYR
ncbi:hypothetical protein MMC10_006702 [Thelotrema lepadinum]|nr:hypothetical protein [Thelotrema lepadinum]